MLYIGFNEVIKHWKQTLLMALQIGMIMFLAVMAVTTYKAQTEKYDPLRAFMNREGVAFEASIVSVNEADGIDKYMDRLGVFDEFHCVRKDSLYLYENLEGKFEVRGYDELLSEYEPEMSEGVWFTDAKKEEGIINAVVTGNPYGIEVGDVIEFSNSSYNKKIKVYICGMFKDGEAFYEVGSYSSDCTVFDYYQTYDSAREDKNFYLFMSADDMVSQGMTATYGRVLASYDENASESQKEYAGKKLAQDNDIVVPMSEVVERTEDIIDSKMVEIMPVFVGAFLLVTLSIACLSAIDTYSSVENYAILFICGMEWKKSLPIGAVKSTIICGFSVVVMLLIYGVTVITKISEKILFEPGLWQAIICILISIYMIGISCIMPIYILKKNQPVSVLRDSKV